MQVRPGSLVFDPFVGTGSILVAAAHYGAHTMGADIDARVICLGKVPPLNQVGRNYSTGEQSTMHLHVYNTHLCSHKSYDISAFPTFVSARRAQRNRL